jgi:signal transduction histidine kinase/CheY-like chemotaxis protein
MFGYPSTTEVLELEDIRSLFAEPDRVTTYITDRLMGKPAPELYAVKGLKKDGTTIDLENRAFAIRWGAEMAVCAMLTDVTEQRAMEIQLRQSQRLDAVGQLTGGVAHDFNNLLTVILGNAELLEEGLSGDDELRTLAEVTRTAARRGADLTSRLLSFSRRQSLDPKVVDIGGLIFGMSELLRRTLGGNIEFKNVIGDGLWNAFVDASQLENAVLNLCINARDAMPDGGMLTLDTSNVELDEIYAANHPELKPGKYVQIAVSDTGTGMSEETLSRVFEPFFTTKDVGKGSGLGLSMVYGFAKQSRGHVMVYSELGHGTSVKLYLPYASAEVDRRDPPASISDIPGGSEKILLVEDDDMVRAHVSNQLRSLGYEIVSVANGLEAIKALKMTSDFDLLFTDVVMPGGINGPKLAKMAADLHPNLPVLFTSGYTENAIVHHGRLDAGANLLSKPYQRQDLALKLRQVLKAVGSK